MRSPLFLELIPKSQLHFILIARSPQRTAAEDAERGAAF